VVRAKTLLDLRGTAAVKAIVGNVADMPTSSDFCGQTQCGKCLKSLARRGSNPWPPPRPSWRV